MDRRGGFRNAFTDESTWRGMSETDRFEWRDKTRPKKYRKRSKKRVDIEMGMDKEFYEEQLNQRISEIAAQLSPFQKDFAEYYAITGNHTKAAKAAGSTAKAPGKVGANTLHEPLVQEYVELLRKKGADLAALELTEVVRNARELYKSAMKDNNLKAALEANKQLMDIVGVNTVGPAKAPGIEPKETNDEDTVLDMRDTMKSLIAKTKSKTAGTEVPKDNIVSL